MTITKLPADVRRHSALLIGALVLALTFAFTGAAYADDDDLEITGLRWSGDTQARWDKNSNCYKYEVKLYRDSSSRTTKTTTDNYYDFDSYMNSKGDYHFEVRGCGQNGEYGEWYSSEYIYVSSEDAKDNRSGSGTSDVYHGPGVVNGGYYPYYGYYGGYYNGYYDPYTGYYYDPYYYNNYNSYNYGPSMVTEGEGIVVQGAPYSTYNTQIYSSAYNYWVQDMYGWKYHLADGSYPRSCWLEIDGLFYCFDVNGYMRQNSWISYNGKQYYVGEDGSLQANTYTPDGHYVGSDGAMIF